MLAHLLPSQPYICQLPTAPLSKEAAAGQGRHKVLFVHAVPPLAAANLGHHWSKLWWRFSGFHLSLISGIFPYFQHLPLLSVITVSFWDLSFLFPWLSGHPSSCFQIKWSRCSRTPCYQPCSRWFSFLYLCHWRIEDMQLFINLVIIKKLQVACTSCI